MAFTVVKVDPKASAKAEVVAAAKDVLAMAEAGEIVDLSWSASCIDGTVKTGFTSTEDGLRRQGISNEEKARRRHFVLRRLLEQAFERENGRCFYCDSAVHMRRNARLQLNDDATIDHIIPRSEGGLDRIGNVVLSCYHCNHERGTTPAHEFLARQS